MARFLSLRRILSPTFASPAIARRSSSFCSEPTENKIDSRAPTITTFDHRIQLPELIPSSRNRREGFNIELMDSDIWRVSFSIAEARKVSDVPSKAPAFPNGEDDEARNRSSAEEQFPDFDEIEDLMLRKKLFYKLDKGSKEFKECDVNFHRKKSSNKRREKAMQAKLKKESKKHERPSHRGANLVKPKVKTLPQARESFRIDEAQMGSKSPPSMEGKRARTPTFNQLTDPYHLPFCLDIYITKGSVRACIVHRATSKVVAVAHSISKDMKSDLTSKKDSTTCAAVGKVLAQRAIEDDIHNAVYTPRKGDRIEGKLQVVLQSVIDNGIDVKVKLKQKNPVKNKDEYDQPDQMMINLGRENPVPPKKPVTRGRGRGRRATSIRTLGI